jgi:hypothetical protein
MCPKVMYVPDRRQPPAVAVDGVSPLRRTVRASAYVRDFPLRTATRTRSATSSS